MLLQCAKSLGNDISHYHLAPHKAVVTMHSIFLTQWWQPMVTIAPGQRTQAEWDGGGKIPDRARHSQQWQWQTVTGEFKKHYFLKIWTEMVSDHVEGGHESSNVTHHVEDMRAIKNTVNTARCVGAHLWSQHLRGRGRSILVSLSPSWATEWVQGQLELHGKTLTEKRNLKIYYSKRHTAMNLCPSLPLALNLQSHHLASLCRALESSLLRVRKWVKHWLQLPRARQLKSSIQKHDATGYSTLWLSAVPQSQDDYGWEMFWIHPDIKQQEQLS